ncbi:MAG: hypothetical protein Q4G68_09790 [Planctomycetia bacterium]|nr:hypothetical protein [Planctomycetia bacterium]
MGSAIETTSTLDPVVIKTIGLLLAGSLISLALWQILTLRQTLATLNVRRSLVKRARLFLRRQCLRRLQMHVLLGLAGIGMLVGIYVPPQIHPLLWTSAWCSVIFLLSWAMLLALVDYISIRLHFSGPLQQQNAEKLNLEYQLKCIREALAKEKADARLADNADARNAAAAVDVEGGQAPNKDDTKGE